MEDSGLQFEEYNTSLPTKKRRIPGACDACKRKKARCDSAKRSDNRCSNCVHFSLECTHTEVGKTLGSARLYVERLETRLEKVDRLFTKLLPGLNVNRELQNLGEGSFFNDKQPEKLPRNDGVRSELASHLIQLDILNPSRLKFFGKSSNVNLLKTVIDLKWIHTGHVYKGPIHDSWGRQQNWDVPKWTKLDSLEIPNVQLPTHYKYPPKDLLTCLVDLYFTQLNPILPLLHRPIFEHSVEQGLHHRDPQFGATVLLVCAHGAKYSDDPRVLADGSDEWQSAGWKWYEQVRRLGHYVPLRPTLYHVQLFALISLFSLQGPVPEDAWLHSGAGLKLAVDVGAHSKGGKNVVKTLESELWKRAFWCLYLLDIRYSIAFGRCPGLRVEDFDVEYPVMCDDEYWAEGFIQPEGQPSQMAFFKSLLELTTIMGRALDLLFLTKEMCNPLPASPLLRSERDCVVDIDSKMQEWLSSLPPHLCLGINQRNDLFKLQSTYLYLTLYHYQTVIYRPYIPTPRNPLPGPFPALAICSKAARNCCRRLYEAREYDRQIITMVPDTIFSVALSLAVCIWGAAQASEPPLTISEMEHFNLCIAMFEESEQRSFMAGRLKYILEDLLDRRKASTAKTSLTEQGTRPHVEVASMALTQEFSTPRNAVGSSSFSQGSRFSPFNGALISGISRRIEGFEMNQRNLSTFEFPRSEGIHLPTDLLDKGPMLSISNTDMFSGSFGSLNYRAEPRLSGTSFDDSHTRTLRSSDFQVQNSAVISPSSGMEGISPLRSEALHNDYFRRDSWDAFWSLDTAANLSQEDGLGTSGIRTHQQQL